MTKLFSWIFRKSGWKVQGEFPYHLKKYIVLVAPHTSNWDFVIGICARAYLKMSHAKYLGKDSLFKGPTGWIFYSLGGYPVDRSKHTNLVDSAIQIFNEHDTFVLALAPEGTRKKVDRIKTGFWYIANSCEIPIVLCGLDYSLKSIVISDPMTTSNLDSDLKIIRNFFAGIVGKRPELGIFVE